MDIILVDDGRKLYKIRIDKSEDFVGLDILGVYNEGFEVNGWVYIYYDNYVVKKFEYELIVVFDV